MRQEEDRNVAPLQLMVGYMFILHNRNLQSEHLIYVNATGNPAMLPIFHGFSSLVIFNLQSSIIIITTMTAHFEQMTSYMCVHVQVYIYFKSKIRRRPLLLHA